MALAEEVVRDVAVAVPMGETLVVEVVGRVWGTGTYQHRYIAPLGCNQCPPGTQVLVEVAVEAGASVGAGYTLEGRRTLDR